MVRWTVTARDGVKERGEEPNAVLAYKASVALAQQKDGGAIITVDDLDTTNTVFHTEVIAEASR